MTRPWPDLGAREMRGDEPQLEPPPPAFEPISEERIQWGQLLFWGSTAIAAVIGIAIAFPICPTPGLASVWLAWIYLGAHLIAACAWGGKEWFAERTWRIRSGARNRSHRILPASPTLRALVGLLSFLDILTCSSMFGRRSEVFKVPPWNERGRERLVQRRARWIEWYMIAMSALLIMLLFAAGADRVNVYAAACMAWFVVFQLVVVGVLISIVHFVSAPIEERSVSSQPRLAVLAIVNYLQVLLAFAVIYAVADGGGNLNAGDALAASAKVQMTLSADDELPRIQMHLHLAATLMVDLLVVSRFISMLPSYRGYLDR